MIKIIEDLEMLKFKADLLDKISETITVESNAKYEYAKSRNGYKLVCLDNREVIIDIEIYKLIDILTYDWYKDEDYTIKLR